MEPQDRRELQNRVTKAILTNVPPEYVEVFMEELVKIVDVYARERNLLSVISSTD
jgi:predicted RNA binding protein with dsRBD fold (UPF0201 family)